MTEEQGVQRLSASSITSIPIDRQQPPTEYLVLIVRWYSRLVTIELWQESIMVLWRMLVGALLSLAWSSVALIGVWLGHVVTRIPPERQSYAVFCITVMVWNQSLYCGIVIVAQSTLLTRQRFVDNPSRPPSLRSCVWRMLRASWVSTMCIVIITIAFNYSLDHVTHGTFRSFRLEYHANIVFNLIFMVRVAMACHEIFLRDTVRGRTQCIDGSPTANQVLPMLSRDGRELSGRDEKTQRNRRRLAASRMSLRVCMRTSPTSLFSVLAGLYVQFSTRFSIETRQELIVFSVGSLVLKVVVQEIIRLIMVHLKVKDTRMMFLSVGLPTVLIDTQIRMKLQRFQTVNMSVSGSIALAMIEIVLRWSKVFFLRARLRSRERPLNRAGKASNFVPSGSSRTISRFVATFRKTSARLRRRARTSAGVKHWRQQLLRFHAAEIYADMSAEYIAIGCSAMLFYVLSGHVKYKTAFAKNSDATAKTAQSTRSSVGLIAFQVVLEVVVDLFSCVLERIQGVEFSELRKYEGFIAIVFVGIGLINVFMSTVMYTDIDGA